MSGHLANPIPDTGYEPKFCIDVISAHKPINLPTRNRHFPREYDATIATTEDLDLPRHSEVSSSSKLQAAASRVPTVSKLGSLGNSLTQVLAVFFVLWTVVQAPGETCADMDRETVVSTLLGSVSKEKRDRDQDVVPSSRDRHNLHKILERSAELAVRGGELAQQRLYKAEADVEVEHWEKRNSDIAEAAVFK